MSLHPDDATSPGLSGIFNSGRAPFHSSQASFLAPFHRHKQCYLLPAG
jgi:hypothetical protein